MKTKHRSYEYHARTVSSQIVYEIVIKIIGTFYKAVISQVPYLTVYKTHPNFNRANQEKNKVLISNVKELI